MKKILILSVFFYIIFFIGLTSLTAQEEEKKKQEVEIKFEQNAYTEDAYYAYIAVETKEDLPYPNQEDPINQILGRRIAAVYSYKKIQAIIRKELDDFVSKGKVPINEEGYIKGPRIISTVFDFDDKNVDVCVEMSFEITKQEFLDLKRRFQEKYPIKMIENIMEEYDQKLYEIHYSYYKKYIENPDDRFVDLKIIES